MFTRVEADIPVTLPKEIQVIHAGIECGQSMWRRHSWRHKPRLRRFPKGFAIGPIMFWRG